MKIAILYIGTGLYTIFWKDFYKSCEKFFIKGAHKHYFFFTDSQVFGNMDNVSIIPQENLGWPMIACLRYKILNRIREQLKDYDYVFFFNGNMEFIKPVDAQEFLPTIEQGGLVAALHPMNKRIKNPDDYPYERNQISTSNIPLGQGKYYYQTAIIGGMTEEALNMLEECEKMMDEDLSKGIIPIFHDESLYNKYILDKQCLCLSNKKYMRSEHGKPWIKLTPRTKIIQRDKSRIKYGGHAYLRGESTKKRGLFQLFAK